MNKQEQPLHVIVRHAMIDKKIKGKDLARKLRRDPSLITLALQGKAPFALKRIAKIVL